MASIFDDQPKIAVESVTQSNLWMPDTEFIKYKLPDQPKPPTGIAIKAPFEKLDHDLYRPAAQSKLCEVSNTCAGFKDDNPTDNTHYNYDSKMSKLNQNIDDLKGFNQQKLEKELQCLVLSSNQMKKQFQLHEIHVPEIEYEVTISTHNRFTGLTTQNDDMTDISEKIRDEQKVKKDDDNSIHEKIRDEQKVKKDDDNSIPKEKPYRYAQDLEIIIDPHGNGLTWHQYCTETYNPKSRFLDQERIKGCRGDYS
ncbi:unnamed protein product [Mytilus coruscus]|uniref:Uncharacterized protein n=1 Tax=Mytilus coruscus TaxID=42192 RepID=A0A6J8AHN6_MYTCO|nr:unnamed protein product [Mytilus coruscus]